MRKKIIRACTVSMSIGFVERMLPDLMQKYEVVLLSSPGPEMDRIREKYGVRTIAVPMERHISFFHDFVSLIRLIRAFRKEKPQMVHSMTPKAGLLCMLAAWLTRVTARVHTFTGLIWPTERGLKRRILMATDWLTCACATHIIPEGEGVKNDLQIHGITKKPMKVLGYGNVKGVDLEYYSRSEKLKVKSERLHTEGVFTFLFVGRIVGDKGINELVGAFQKLYNNFPTSRLLLVGRLEYKLDPIAEETQRIIDNHPCIEAVGEKNAEELLVYYASADCFVFPSYREGFPNTVLEAGSMGLPCIVTDINGSREIIREGENGVVIPPKDKEALYEAMKLMITDNEMRQRMASNARPMIAERFDQNLVRRCLLDFYESILGC